MDSADNADGDRVDRTPVCRFGPDRRLTALTAVLAACAALGILITTDRPGRVLLGCAVVVLLGYVLTDLAYWPRLIASADGLIIRSPAGSAAVRWADVDAVRADTRLRLGLRSITLEIDAADRLHVFSKRTLGADPVTAAALISALDPRG